MSRLLCWLVGPLLAAIVGGCSRYVEGYHYLPRPVVAEIPATQPSQPPPVVAIASVVGVRRADRDADLPAAVEVLLRLENNGPATVVFDPQSLDLSDGAMVRFPPPILHGSETVTLAPMDAVGVSALFPFPPGHSWDNTDLSSLRMRWLVHIDGRTVGQVVRFDRAYPVYSYEPYPYWGYGPYPYYYPYGWYGGWYGGVVVHRR